MIKHFGGTVTPAEKRGMIASLVDQHSAVLGAVEDASRRVRRCRKRHPRPRLRAALWRAPGRDEGMAVSIEQRDGSGAQAAICLAACWGLNRVRQVSMAQATPSSRSATLRKARPWL